MLNLPNYQIHAQIYESANSLVYRGDNQANNKPVILKLLRENYPTPAELTRYKQEYRLTHQLNLSGVIKALALIEYGNTLIIVFEDFGGESLKQLLPQQQFNLKEYLQLGIKITESLGNIHQVGIIHKDINPTNIVYNPKTKQLKIIDFGIATLLNSENPTVKNPSVLEGTLAYISPEQTGRMNRSLDYRSDFYSLGVSLYELLTGKLPFETEDALELLHCHLAKKPLPINIYPSTVINHQLSTKERAIVEILDQIIQKLMAKTAEERYQSAWGIKADLEACLSLLETKEEIQPFILGEKDRCDRFFIPEKLYGREQEIATLLAAFNAIAKKEGAIRNKLILVSGYSGIGKSALVKELYKPITEARGYFIWGKFEQYQRDIPYSAVAIAFQNLIKQILCETEEILQQWREKLLSVLGENGQLITDVIPEVKLIIGEQKKIEHLSGMEAQNRFNWVFRKFLKVFATSEHPLVLFIDDLQWADNATLKLIEVLIKDREIENFLLIGAYRDNEVNETHPLNLVLDEMKKAEIDGKILELKPLLLKSINQLILETFQKDIKSTNDLGELILSKTNGNPFFIKEFLKTLYEKKLIKFKQQEWHWDIEQIKTENITDNVVELMLNKLKTLTPMTQKILSLAACLGAEFQLKDLAIVAEKTIEIVFADLTEAINLQLIIPTSKLDNQLLYQDYKFLHDRVQQAAYTLVSEVDKMQIHYTIGKFLIKNINLNQPSDKIFDVVNHLNKSLKIITEKKEIEELIKLNWIAGKKAKMSIAYTTAFGYLETGISLIKPQMWKTQYSLILSISEDFIEIAYLSGKHSLAINYAKRIFSLVKTPLDKVNISTILIQIYQAQNQSQQAILITQEVLTELGEKLPLSPTLFNIFINYLNLKMVLINKEINDLLNLSLMTNPKKKSVMKLLQALCSSAYTSQPKLYLWITLRLVFLSIKYGNSPESATAYMSYGVFLCGFLENFSLGHKFSEIALNLSNKLNYSKNKAQIFFVSNYLIKHWLKHIKDESLSFLEGYENGVKTGNFEYASLSLITNTRCLFYSGENLAKLLKLISKNSKILKELKQEKILNYYKIGWQAILNLIGSSKEVLKLNGEVYNEDIMFYFHIKNNDYNAVFSILYYKFFLSYLFKNYQLAKQNIMRSKKYLNAVISSPMIPLFYFYQGLIELALWNNKNYWNNKYSLLRVIIIQKKLGKYSKYAPMNFQHKYDLVSAEKARVLGNDLQAMELYDKAIKGAKDNQYLHEEALANELAAYFYLGRKQTKIAAVYLNDARYLYLKWGANAKVKALDEEYPQLLTQFSHKNSLDIRTTLSNNVGSNINEQLDLATLIKTSKALSQSENIDHLLESLIKFLVENTGGQTGLIFLEKNGEFNLELSYYLDELSSQTKQTYPSTIINYVQRTQSILVLDNASKTGIFTKDKYIQNQQTKSVLCLPLLSQSKTIGILYLDNNLSDGVFNEDRLEVVKLISAQAAIAIENALLRKQEENLNYEYQVGGSLEPNSPSYVVRKADQDLYQALKKGQFCYVLNSRHMGKSSLRVQMMQQLYQEGFTCVAIDLTAIGSTNIKEEQWYAGFIYKLVNNLNLSNQFNFKQWWKSLDFLSPVQKLSEFIEQVLLKQIEGKIVIFIDEIDSTISLKFSTDDFFASIRAMYNVRADNPEYNRLSFVLLGVATPASLIENKEHTPFNIGTAITLEGFKLEEVKPLIRGLESKYAQGEILVKEVLKWTGGQPFLTQKICNLIMQSSEKIEENREVSWVENLVKNKIINNWETQDEPQHLKTIRDRLLPSKNSANLLQLWRRILTERKVLLDSSDLQRELLLSGIVKQEHQSVVIFNRIYEQVFSLDWLEQQINQNL